MEVEGPCSLEYFSGGVPPGPTFKMILDDLRETAALSRQASGIDRMAEICLVGVASYFEAFCKDHAASIISIEPQLIGKLRARNYETKIDAEKALRLGSHLQSQIGFLLMEACDFGSAQKINAIYSCLLNITPFSKDEIKRYDEILRDRNLIVHHGAVYTTRYLEQSKNGQHEISDAFWNSLVVSRDMVEQAIDFVEAIAKKLLSSSHAALTKYVAGIPAILDDERQKALNLFIAWE